MSLPNLVHTVYRGEVGKIIEFNNIKDANGLVNLDPYTVTLNLELRGTVTANDLTVTKRDQGTDEGRAYRAWSTEINTLAFGRHKGHLKLVNGAEIRYWPCDENDNRSHFIVNVKDPID